MICFCIFKECFPFIYLRRLWKCDASPNKCCNLWPFPFWRFIMCIKILKVLIGLEIKKKILLNFMLSSIYQSFWIQTTFLHYTWVLLEIQFSSVTQSCLTLCDPMDCNTPGLPVHHQLPQLAQTRPMSQGGHTTISSSVVPFSSCPQSLPASGSFPMSQLFSSGGQSIGVSASASVLSMNTKDLFPLGWTGWISLQSKGLSRVVSNTTVQKHNFFGAQLSL